MQQVRQPALSPTPELYHELDVAAAQFQLTVGVTQFLYLSRFGDFLRQLTAVSPTQFVVFVIRITQSVKNLQ